MEQRTVPDRTKTNSHDTHLITVIPSSHRSTIWRGMRYQLRHLQRRIRALPKPVRVALISVLGTTVVLAGILMLIAPGPGILTILLGLSILATEFAWAAGTLKRLAKLTSPYLEWMKRCWRNSLTAGPNR
jgi:uncharacterized protein (TIGR02611 family)